MSEFGRILLTGSEGYVAAHLRSSTNLHMTGVDLHGNADVSCCISQLGQYLDSLQDVTHVIHLADLRFQFHNDDNFNEQSHIQKTFTECLKQLPGLKNVVFASSCSVYGVSDDVIDESSPTHVTSHYARAKLETEAYLKNSALPVTILRFATAFGGQHKIREDLFVNMAVKNCLKRTSFDVFGLDHWRPYIHVTDFARALLFFCKNPPGGLVNVVESNHTKNDVISALASAGISTSAAKMLADTGEPRNYRVKNEKMQELGFECETGFVSGITRLAEHYA